MTRRLSQARGGHSGRTTEPLQSNRSLSSRLRSVPIWSEPHTTDRTGSIEGNKGDSGLPWRREGRRGGVPRYRGDGRLRGTDGKI